MNLNEVITNVTIAKACSIKPVKDSTESKTVTVRVKFDGVTLQSVFNKAVSSAIIQWQNGPGRKSFDRLKNGQTVDIQFVAPGRTTIDPETAMVALLQTMTEEEKLAYLEKLVAKASK